MDAVYFVATLAPVIVVGIVGKLWWNERNEEKRRRYQAYLDSRVKPRSRS